MFLPYITVLVPKPTCNLTLTGNPDIFSLSDLHRFESGFQDCNILYYNDSEILLALRSWGEEAALKAVMLKLLF